jgi:hypothetical protein
MRTLVLSICAAAFMASPALAYDDKIIALDGQPIEITSYFATYNSGAGSMREGVMHRVGFKNVSGKKIVAYKIGFMSFDAFRDPLGRGFEGYSVDEVSVDSDANGAWIQTMLEAAIFNRFGVGIAYPAKVRFDDGSIWSADLAKVAMQASEISSKITADSLEQK